MFKTQNIENKKFNVQSHYLTAHHHTDPGLPGRHTSIMWSEKGSVSSLTILLFAWPICHFKQNKSPMLKPCAKSKKRRQTNQILNFYRNWKGSSDHLSKNKSFWNSSALIPLAVLMQFAGAIAPHDRWDLLLSFPARFAPHWIIHGLFIKRISLCYVTTGRARASGLQVAALFSIFPTPETNETTQPHRWPESSCYCENHFLSLA